MSGNIERWGFVWDWMLPGSGGNSMIGYLINLIGKGRE